MAQYLQLSVSEAWARLQKHKAQNVFVDIRDHQSFLHSHPKGATHLNVADLAAFTEDNEPDTPIFILCYHGISSQNVARYLCGQGFTQVYNVDGGFDAWLKASLPVS